MKNIFALLIIQFILIQNSFCNFSGFLQKVTKVFIEELQDIHLTELYSLEELTIYKVFQVSRFSFQNLQNQIEVQEIQENQEYNIKLIFENPRGVLSMNNEKVNLPISLTNLSIEIKIQKMKNKQAFFGTEMDINYDDISFDLGFIGYVIPDSVLRGESMKNLANKAEKRGLQGFNKFLEAFSFMKFKDNSLVLDMAELFKGDNSSQDEETKQQNQSEL